MSYSVLFKFPDATTFDASGILTGGLSVKESLCNDKFESSKNTAIFETVFDNTLLGKIDSASGFVSVEVKDGATWIFNGILQPLTDLSITNQRDKFTFELLDRGALLEFNLTAPKFYNGQTVQSIVNDLLTGSGLSVSAWPSRAGTSTVTRGNFNTDEAVWNLIEKLLKEFGFIFYFGPDGSLNVSDSMQAVASTVTIDDSANQEAIDGSVKLKKNSEKGRGEKISVQADYWEAYKMDSQSVFTSAIPEDTNTITFKSVASLNAGYFNTCAKATSGTPTELKFLDSQTFNISKPKTEAKYLGAENMSGTLNFIAAYDDGTAGTVGVDFSPYWRREFKIIIVNGSITSAKYIVRGGTPNTWTTLSSGDYVFTFTQYADKAVVSFKITNSVHFKLGAGTLYFNRLITQLVKLTADIWLGSHVEPVKISNSKTKVDSYTLNYAQTAAQAQDFLNLKSDIANNRSWSTTWESYTDHAIGTGATVSMTRAGVSTSGVIVEKKTSINYGVTKFDFKLIAFSTITITTPAAQPISASEPVRPASVDVDGNNLAPIISNLIPQIDLTTLAESGIILHQDEFGFYDQATGLWNFRVKSNGEVFAGSASKNLTFDPTTGDLTLTGDIVAGGGEIAGWEIMTDLLRSAGSGARIELNKTKSRISIFDASSEVAAMGYIDGLTDPVVGGALPAGTYGFWSKPGTTLNFNANIGFSGLVQNRGANVLEVGELRMFMSRTAPAGWLALDGAEYYDADYPELGAFLNPLIGVCTISIANPAVITLTAHGFTSGEICYITTTGSLPAPITGGNYIVTVINANTFKLSQSYALFLAGTFVSTVGGSQSGTHSVHFTTAGRATPDRFWVPDWREMAPTMIGTNGNGWGNIVEHDAFILGPGKDDQMQGHKHQSAAATGGANNLAGGGVQAPVYSTGGTGSPTTDGTNGTPRTGKVTRGKRVGVLYCIKY
jgi:hypothetical protein